MLDERLGLTHPRESADALSVVAREVPAATSLASFESGVRHLCGV